MTAANFLSASETKMTEASVARPAIAAFLANLQTVQAGELGLLAEGVVGPVETLPALSEAAQDDVSTLIPQLVVIKLNGGLGTGMGLDRAKSLLPVKQGLSFLDFIARQILHFQDRCGGKGPRFCLMNSFSTQADTLAALAAYPSLLAQGSLDFLQSKVPKIDADTFLPVDWPQNPELEWCPPGHGDLYPSLLGSGLLDQWLTQGIRYAFVSNSDNLGATVDPALLAHFARSDASFLMEVCERTAADKKGGHLARRESDGRLVLRESAQTRKEDEAAFQDISRYRYFNTNNLWIRLDRLKDLLKKNNGRVPLPVIVNRKTVDPKKADSPAVLQLESAMGAAIECFPDSTALVVPRTRFAPVKTTSDLLALRSDAFEVTADHRIELASVRAGLPPLIDLDSRYKLTDALETLTVSGIPSLIGCGSLKLKGPLQFASGVVCVGNVVFENKSSEAKTIPPGRYENQTVTW
jgi:UDP-N-acetylglucosamine pyrophosphorylase